MDETGNGEPQDAPTSASAPDAPAETPAKDAKEGGQERILVRSAEGRMITGVCAGLGRHTGIDPVLFRVAFAVLVLGSGLGIMLYIAAFLLMRESDGRPGYIEQWTRRVFDAETVLALLCAVLAFGLVLNLASGGIGPGTMVVATLLVIALLAAHAAGKDLRGMFRRLPDGLRHTMPETPPTPWERQAAAAGHAPPPAPPTAPTAPGMFPGQGAPSAPRHEPGRMGSPFPPTPQPTAAHASPGITRTDLGPPSSSGAPGAPGRTGTWTAGGGYDSSGAPFAPRGPYVQDDRAGYRPPDPRRAYDYGPPPHGHYGATAVPYPRPRRPRSYIGAITIVLACIVGGMVMVIQTDSGQPGSLTVVGGAVLVTIGCGLLVATWFGRGAGLVVTGALVALTVAAGSTVSGLPENIGNRTWRPTTVADAQLPHRVGMGEGLLDLSELKARPGSRIPVTAEVSFGQMRVIVPADVRVEVTASSKLGDIKVDHTVRGGPEVTLRKVLPPERKPEGEPATIVLRVRAGVGDVEVRRAA